MPKRTFYTFDPILWFDTETCGLDPKTKDIWQIGYIIEEKNKVVIGPKSIIMRPVNPLMCPSCKFLLNGDLYPYKEWYNRACPKCGTSKVIENIDPDALNMLPETFEKLVTESMSPKEAFKLLTDDLSKFRYKDKRGVDQQVIFYPAGFNIRFDIDFFMEWINKLGFEDKWEAFRWIYPGASIDVRAIFIHLYKRLREYGRLPDIEKFKLENTCSFMDAYLGPENTYGLNKTAESSYHDAAYDIKVTKSLYDAIVSIEKKLESKEI